MKKLTLYFSFFIAVYFFFNTINVNSIDDIALIYDRNEIKEGYYNISFYDFNINELDEVFKGLDVKIINVRPSGFDSMEYITTNKLIEAYQKKLIYDDYDEKAINIGTRGFKIESMLIKCTNEELYKLENRVNII